MQQSDDPYRKAAAAKKLKQLPPDVHAAAKAKPATIDTPAPLHSVATLVAAAYDEVFEGQLFGVNEVQSTLDKIKPPSNIIAQVALAAVSIAISAVLTPALGMVLEGMAKGAMTEILKVGMEETLHAAVDAAKEELAEQLNEESSVETEADAISEFIVWQQKAIARAKREAKEQVVKMTDDLIAAGDLDQGLKALNALLAGINKQVGKAAEIQVLHSAGQWAGAKREELFRSVGQEEEIRAIDVRDVDRETMTGNLELWVSLDYLAPHPRVTKANWSEISRDLENLIKRQGSLPIRELGARLYVNLDVEDAKHQRHEAIFEYTPAPEVAEGGLAMPIIVIPDDASKQRIICSAVSGDEQISDGDLVGRSMTAIGQLGYDIAGTPVNSLKFG
jgi:hypothetical protein